MLLPKENLVLAVPACLRLASTVLYDYEVTTPSDVST